MIAPILQPIIRRAILDLVADMGGELNDEMVTILLNEIGHRVARTDIRVEIAWLGEAGLLTAETVGLFEVARSTPAGLDVAAGTLRFDGVSRHKTGD